MPDDKISIPRTDHDLGDLRISIGKYDKVKMKEVPASELKAFLDDKALTPTKHVMVMRALIGKYYSENYESGSDDVPF